MISLRDWVRAATHLAGGGTASGVYNVSAPHASTNADLGRALGRSPDQPDPPGDDPSATIPVEIAGRTRLIARM